MCGHYIADPSHGIKGDKSKNFKQMELMCPICKRPSNVQLPVYESSVIDLLSNAQKKSDTRESDFLATLTKELCLTLEDHMRQGWWRDTSCYNKRSLAQFELQSDHIQLTNQKIYDFIKDNMMAREVILDEVNMTNRTSVEELADTMTDILRYTEVYGFVPTIQSFGQVYNSLYVTLRLIIITEAESLASKPELIGSIIFSKMLAHLLAVLFSGVESEDFEKIDLNSLFSRAAILSVNFYNQDSLHDRRTAGDS
jgi:hypothetical protein